MKLFLRILLVYILISVGSVAGWALFTYFHPHMQVGMMNAANCQEGCLLMPVVVVLIGPLIVSFTICMCFRDLNSGIGLTLFFLLLCSLYVLQFLVLYRLTCKRIWQWGIVLVLYSVWVGYWFPLFITIT